MAFIEVEGGVGMKIVKNKTGYTVLFKGENFHLNKQSSKGYGATKEKALIDALEKLEQDLKLCWKREMNFDSCFCKIENLLNRVHEKDLL